MVTAMTTYLTKITAFTFKSYITDLPPVHIYSPVRRFTTIHNSPPIVPILSQIDPVHVSIPLLEHLF